MIKVQSEADLPLKMTSRLIAQKAMSRGWQPLMYAEKSGRMRLVKPNGTELEIYTAMPPTTTHIAANNSDNKYLTHLILEEQGLPVLQTFLCQTDEEALQAARQILDTNAGLVVKPLDAGHGDGITVGITAADDLTQALDFARQYSDKIIIQAFQPNAVDLRLVCIEGAFVAALQRIPARIKGDGIHTIAELIAIENKETRSVQYTTDITAIPVDRAAAYLGTAMHDIPQADLYITVLGTANVGTGGETADVTDMLPDWLKQMAEDAARVINLPVCGVDFLLIADPQVDMTIDQARPAITEINKNPSLYIHEQPNHGISRPVIDSYLDYLDSI